MKQTDEARRAEQEQQAADLLESAYVDIERKRLMKVDLGEKVGELKDAEQTLVDNLPAKSAVH